MSNLTWSWSLSCSNIAIIWQITDFGLLEQAQNTARFWSFDLWHCKCKNWSFCCIWQDWLDVKLLGLPNARSSPSCNYQKLFVLSISKDILGLDHTIAIIEWACLLCLAYSCFFWLRSFMLLMITIIFPMCIGLLPTWWWAIRKGAAH